MGVSYHKITGFLTDNANIISENYKQRITSLAEQIEKETSVEVAVVTVLSLEGLSKEEYAIGLAEANRIGKKDVDNGLLILIAQEEGEYRVEVGYGLEGLIPDSSKVAIGTRIIEPNFKQGEFGKGIYESLLTVQALLKGQEEVVSDYRTTKPAQGLPVQAWIYFLFVFLLIFGGIFGRRRGLLFLPIFLPGSRGGFSGGAGGFGGFGGGGFGGGGFGGRW